MGEIWTLPDICAKISIEKQETLKVAFDNLNNGPEIASAFAYCLKDEALIELLFTIVLLYGE